MSSYKAGPVISEGKTKIISEVKGNPNLVVVGNKDDITAFDDPAFTKNFNTKGGYSTSTTSRIFELLLAAGVPVAFKEQISDTEFVADKCKMISLEVIARRYAVGSCLKRHPNLAVAEGEQPHRFHRLLIEFFLKTAGGKLEIDGKTIIKGLNHVVDGESKTLDDPYIANPDDDVWNLFHPKKPKWNQAADLHQTVASEKVLSKITSFKGDEQIPVQVSNIKDIKSITRKVFLVLEGAWQTLGHRLIDFKIEFGITPDGRIVVSDVIDNDSWRLRDADWEELSKQAFRDGEDLSEVEKKYGLVAALTERLRIPRQAIVLWRGSESDDITEISTMLKNSGINTEDVVLSGHKSPNGSTKQLEQILGKYPDGGVIIVIVGRSNGLGPILAARTSWPVIAVPATLGDFPEDVWSSLRMPSNVPLLTAWPAKNAVLAAMDILAQKNPIAYALRQLEIEEFDE